MCVFFVVVGGVCVFFFHYCFMVFNCYGICNKYLQTCCTQELNVASSARILMMNNHNEYCVSP